MKRKQNMKTRFSHPKPLDADEELRVVETIRKGSQFIGKDKLSDKEELLAKEAIQASHRLVEAYSFLIETIAKEKFKNAGRYADLDEYISEAYIVALQCALTFNPYASSRGTIRFSSYAPLAISSSLKRLSMRSRSIVSVPVAKMTSARAWSHTKFDLENRGIEATDEEVSSISGISSTQKEVKNILKFTDEVDIENESEPSVFDDHQVISYQQADRAIQDELASDFWQSSSEIIKSILGIDSKEVSVTPFDLSSKNDGISRKDAEKYIHWFRAVMQHPAIRMRFAHSFGAV